MSWREHLGGPCPIGAEQFARLKLRCGWITKEAVQAGKYRWSHKGEPGDIVAWREI